MIIPFEHQLEVLDILKKNNKGKIILPTGTGKTLIQGLDLYNRISKESGFGIYIVLSPRIMLSYQLLTEFHRNNLPTKNITHFSLPEKFSHNYGSQIDHFMLNSLTGHTMADYVKNTLPTR